MTLDQSGGPRSNGLPGIGAYESPASGLVSFSGDPNADSNQDGISDFQHFASGTDRNGPYDQTSTLQINPDGTLVVHRRRNAPGLNLIMELSVDLDSYTEMIPGIYFNIASRVLQGDREIMVLEILPPFNEISSLFYRARWR